MDLLANPHWGRILAIAGFAVDALIVVAAGSMGSSGPVFEGGGCNSGTGLIIASVRPNDQPFDVLAGRFVPRASAQRDARAAAALPLRP